MLNIRMPHKGRRPPPNRLEECSLDEWPRRQHVTMVVTTPIIDKPISMAVPT